MPESTNSSDRRDGGKERLSLWYCESCRVVHLRAGEVVLSFDSRQFAAFTEAVVDIHYGSGWQMSQWALPRRDETAAAHEILSSEIIL